MKLAIRPFVLNAMLIALALSIPQNSSGQTIEWIGGNNDWFNLFGWSTGQVPGANNHVLVNNGGTAIADFSSQFNNSGAQINIGGLTVDGGGNGAAEFNDLDLNVGGGISIGILGNNNTQGSLITTAGSNANGNVSVGGNVLIAGGLGNFPGTVNADANIAGSLTGAPTSRLQIGAQFAIGGSTHGVLTVGGDISNFGLINFGYGASSSFGIANATIDVAGSINSAGSTSDLLNIAYTTGDADAAALVHVGTGVAGFKAVRVGMLDTLSGTNASAFGYLKVDTGGLNSQGAGGLLAIGRSDSMGAAIGELDVSGGITGYQTVHVGFSETTGSGNAHGVLNVVGNLTGSDTGFFEVGKVGGSGNVFGGATISGNVSGYNYVYIGGTTLTAAAASLATAQIDGQLIAGSHPNTGLLIGTSASVSDVNGSLTVGNGISGFRGLLVGGGGGSNGNHGSSDGSLVVTAGGIQGGEVQSGGIASQMAIGSTASDVDSLGSANVVGNISGFKRVSIGEHYDSVANASGNATGNLFLQGDLTGTSESGSLLAIGRQGSASSANGSAVVSGDISGFEVVEIGLNSDGSLGNGTGVLNVGGNLTSATPGTGSLTVGAAFGLRNASGDIGAADVSGFEHIAIGFGGANSNNLTNATGTAFAHSVSPGGAGIHSGSTLSIGVNEGNTSVAGSFLVDNIQGFDLVKIGSTAQGTVGTASGTLLLGADSSIGQLIVAQQDGSGVATGKLSLNDTVLDIATTMQLGDNSELEFLLDGDVDSTSISTGIGVLDGDLTLLFNQGLANGTHVFDLITSESSFGLLGDFDQVNLLGITPDSWTAGIILDTVNNNSVEIYRLTVTTIPEPNALVLFLLASAGLANRRRRSM